MLGPMFLTHLECTACEGSFSPLGLPRACPDCQAPLAARYDLEAAGAALDRSTYASRPGRLWDLAEVLPLADPSHAVTLGEGGTPLLELPRLAAELGVARLTYKDEGQNPTGSFKARGLSVAVTMAKAGGATALAVPSAGNAGGALAAYGARAGLPVVLAMPQDVPAANRIEAEVTGAEVHLLPGTIADCGRWIRERAAEHGWFDLSTLAEPYRVEGKKTMGFELACQLGWTLPDVLLYPTGGGTGLVGIWKAFDEMEAMGWLPKGAPRPRMIAVQAAGCAPMVEAWASGAEHATAPANPHTCAAGLRVPTPKGDRWMLDVLRSSHGRAIAIEDEHLLASTRRLGRSEGLFGAPEVGALVAALATLRAEDHIGHNEHVALIATGAGHKYLECFG